MEVVFDIEVVVVISTQMETSLASSQGDVLIVSTGNGNSPERQVHFADGTPCTAVAISWTSSRSDFTMHDAILSSCQCVSITILAEFKPNLS